MKYVRIPVLEFIPALAVMAVALLVTGLIGTGPWVIPPLAFALYGLGCLGWRVDNGNDPLIIRLPGRKR